MKVYYHPPYHRLVCDYPKAEFTNIRKSLSQINWNGALKHFSVDDQVEYFTSCILNIFSNFVPSKTITCRYKDPPWMTEEVKQICHMKAKIYENYVKNGRSDADKEKLIIITNLNSDAITEAKEKYLYSL